MQQVRRRTCLQHRLCSSVCDDYRTMAAVLSHITPCAEIPTLSASKLYKILSDAFKKLLFLYNLKQEAQPVLRQLALQHQ